MKHIKRIILSLIILTTFSNSVISNQSNLNNQNKSIEFYGDTYQETIREDSALVTTIKTRNNIEFSNSELQNKNLIAGVPENIKSFINNIEIISSEEANGNAGRAFVNTGVIQINENYINDIYVLYHEIGHLVDYSLGNDDKYYSEISKFKEIWKEEWYGSTENTTACPDNSQDWYGCTEIHEGFAEAFAAYHTQTLNYQEYDLLANKPKSYNHIKEIIEIISSISESN